jgi:hypothetical protein
MSYFWTLSVNSGDYAGCALGPYAQHLSLPPGKAGGWGLGWYHVGEVLQRVEPKERGEAFDVEEIVQGLSADLVIMHVREATVGAVRRENTHPFRFKDWLFAHNGTLPGFEKYREEIRAAMPPFVLRNLRGDTDSEHIFHLFLSFLYDGGHLDRPDLGVDMISGALGKAFSMVDELSKDIGADPAPASAVVSDGYSLVVMSRGIPVDYIMIEGVRHCTACRNSIQPSEDGEPVGVNHDDLRAILVRSCGAESEPPAGFQRLDDNSYLLVPKTQDLRFASLDEAL